MQYAKVDYSAILLWQSWLLGVGVHCPVSYPKTRNLLFSWSKLILNLFQDLFVLWWPGSAFIGKKWNTVQFIGKSFERSYLWSPNSNSFLDTENLTDYTLLDLASYLFCITSCSVIRSVGLQWHLIPLKICSTSAFVGGKTDPSHWPSHWFWVCSVKYIGCFNLFLIFLLHWS